MDDGRRTGLTLAASALALAAAGCFKDTPASTCPSPETCRWGSPGCRCTGDSQCDEGHCCRFLTCFGPNAPSPDKYLYSRAHAGDEDLIDGLIQAELHLKPGMQVADIGSGTGSMTADMGGAR